MKPHTAVRLVRWWTSLYTVVLPPDARAARREEVESDLWESLADPDAAHDILPRLLLGAVDDIAWSAEHMDTTGRSSAWSGLGVLLTISVSWLWLANSPMSLTMRETIWAFPLALTCHLLGLVLLFALSGAVDLRLTGLAFADANVSGLIRRLRPWTIVSAVVTAASGVALYMADPAAAAANPLFRIKLGLLALAVVNAGFVQSLALRHVDAWQDARPPALARASGFVSLALWTMVIVAGRLMSFSWFA